DNEAILCVANMSRSAQAVELDMSPWKGRIPREMLGRTRFPPVGDLPYLITLPPYGFFWFLLEPKTESEPESVLPRDVTTLVLPETRGSPVFVWTQHTFEQDVLPAFLPDQRWFADKASRAIKAKVSLAIRFEHNNDDFGAVIVEAGGAQASSRYFLPLTIRWTRYAAIDKNPASVLSSVPRGAPDGTPLAAAADRDSTAAPVGKIQQAESVSRQAAKIEFRPTTVFAGVPLPEIKSVTAVEREQFNSSMVADSRYIVKILRRITAGVHPEIEIGRFLVDVVHFQNAPALLGTVELVEGEARTALAVVHEFVGNQGDAWTITGAALDRFIDPPP